MRKAPFSLLERTGISHWGEKMKGARKAVWEPQTLVLA